MVALPPLLLSAKLIVELLPLVVSVAMPVELLPKNWVNPVGGTAFVVGELLHIGQSGNGMFAAVRDDRQDTFTIGLADTTRRSREWVLHDKFRDRNFF